MEPDYREQRCHRPSAFDKMEGLVREMQDTEHGGVPVRSQKLFLTSIPAAFMGYDLIEWLMERLGIEESEALNLANQLCQYGYFFPVSDTKNLVVKDDSSLYRFQSPYYWPWQSRPPDNVEYSIYLAKRTLRNKQRHGLEDYELEALSNLKKNLANKWDFISMQAEEQVKLAKVLKKGDKVISDSQERAYWRVHRPPLGMVSPLEQCPVPNRSRNGSRTRKKTLESSRNELDLLKKSLSRTRIKESQALESMVQHVETYAEYDPMITPAQPSNPWVTEDVTFWYLNSSIVEVPTEKRVKRWGLSMDELISDLTGLQEFTNYLRKEYSHENIRFWMAVNDLRRSTQSKIQQKVNDIFQEFLAPGAPCEINIDGKTMEKVHQEMKTPNRFTFDAAQEHVYTLLLKKDCYPRFIRSEHYKNLLATGIQPPKKNRFFGFGQNKKKISTTNPTNQQLLQQQTSQGGPSSSSLTKRRGSDRSLSGSAHELTISGVKDTKVPHSHSQSNLSEIPYRVKKPGTAVVPDISTPEEVCPRETSGSESRSRKNSLQLDSGSSSSDISAAVVEISDKIHKTNILTQQHTIDGGRKLVVHTVETPRRASVSVPITHSCVNIDLTKRKVSSFEDTSTPAGTSCLVLDIPSDKFNKTEESIKTLNKNLGTTKTCLVSGISAPIISVSSATEDLPDNNFRNSNKAKVEIFAEREVEHNLQKTTEPLAPLAEPDSESPASELPPSEIVCVCEPPPISSSVAEANEIKGNAVCPWEDEDTCKVETPFVKTYATLGYL